MNIFVTNPDPVVSAQELCDQHCRSKMQIESAIMLQHCFNNDILRDAPPTKAGRSRRAGGGYFKHPCSVWVRESRANYEWLVTHALEMFKERMRRWPQSVEHFTKTFIEWCAKNGDRVVHCKGTKLTPFVAAIKNGSKCCEVPGFAKLGVIEQYWMYIKMDKPFATWTKRDKPTWLQLEH